MADPDIREVIDKYERPQKPPKAQKGVPLKEDKKEGGRKVHVPDDEIKGGK